MTSESRAVLVTAGFLDAREDDLRRIAAGRARLHRLEQGLPLAVAELADVAAAFLSIDLMKAGTDMGRNPALSAFAAAVEAAPGLRWIHTCASGTDRALLQDAMRRGVTVTSSTGANAPAVTASAMAGLLALARGVPQWVRDQDARHWRLPAAAALPRDLAGQHAVVVGVGAIGGGIASACRALGMRVTGIRRHSLASTDCDAVATLEELPTLLPDADWLVLACPLNAHTRGLVDAALLERLPAHAGLVNVARGEAVVEADLFAAVRAGHLGGVYADVFAQEPLTQDSAWWTLPRTLVSPHAAGLSGGFARRTQDMFLDNLERWLSGQPLRNVAQPAPPA
jgi:phosphoglycerate dehydrogenase-like enzyme